MSEVSPDTVRLFRENYPPSGQCPAKAIDDPSQHHIWERTKFGNVSCADCHIPHVDEPLERLTESDLDWLQSVCDAVGPLYGGRMAANGMRQYHGLELFDDEEGEDLTFYLVARDALPAMINAYRALLAEVEQRSDVRQPGARSRLKAALISAIRVVPQREAA